VFGTVRGLWKHVTDASRVDYVHKCYIHGLSVGDWMIIKVAAIISTLLAYI
jgi:hypothetical protein